MRRVYKDFNKIPPELESGAKKNEADLLATKQVKADCYKLSRNELESQFFKKCAYCETEYFVNSDTWIEHFRPKSEYYWLAYGWSNLLPTCTKCNRTKKDNFPLIDEAAKVKEAPLNNGKLEYEKCRADNSLLATEQPYLLHPKIDNTKDFLDFRIDDNFTGVEIIGIDNEGSNDIDNKYAGRGKATIVVCDLNRPDLKIDRYKKVIFEITKILDQTFHDLKELEIPFTDYYKVLKKRFATILGQANNQELEHTLLRQVILNPEKFESLVCCAIEHQDLKEYVLSAYSKFIKSYKTRI